MQNVACIIFLKYPIETKVKTRQLSHLTPTQATDLYRCLVLDTLHNFSEHNIPLFLAYTPKEKFNDFKAWLGNHFYWVAQEDGHLGNRIIKALREIFLNNSIHSGLVFGTDSPDLPP